AADVGLAREKRAKARLWPVIGDRIAHEDHLDGGHHAIGVAIARDLRPVAQARVVAGDGAKCGGQIGALEERWRQRALWRRRRLSVGRSESGVRHERRKRKTTENETRPHHGTPSIVETT